MEKFIFICGNEYDEICRKAGYRVLQTEEMRKKECWSCSSFRGGCKDEGCWCSANECNYKESKYTLEPQ